jgi:hypothetical protein
MLAVVDSAFAWHYIGATDLRDIGRTVLTHRTADGRADDHQYAASSATSERARAGDGRKPHSHVPTDSGGVGDGGARRERRGRL